MNNRFVLFLTVITLGTVIISGCSKSNVNNIPIVVNTPKITSVDFLNVNDSLLESKDSLIVVLKLNDVSDTIGQVSIKLSGDAVYGEQYTTRPDAMNGMVTLPLSMGKLTAEFTIYRTALPQSDKTINMILVTPSKGYKLGEQISSSVKISKKTVAVNTIEFSDNFVDVLDSQSGVIVYLYVLGLPLTKTEDIPIEIIQPEGIAYGINYYTDPPAVANGLKLTAVPGNGNLSFKVIPITNSTTNPYNITFRIGNINQDLNKGRIIETVVRVLKN